MTVTWGLRQPMPVHGAEDGPYVYDEPAAEEAVRWYPKFLRLPEGHLAGQPFHLPPWQANHMRALEGWRLKSNPRFRRYTRSLIAVGRGNAKSSFVAGRSVKGLVGDGVPIPKVIAAGTDRENAGIVFGYSAGMVRQDARLLKRLRVLDSTKRIIRKPADGGLLRVISSDAQHAHGIHPTLLTIDDLQAQPSRDFLGVLGTSQGTVENPLMTMCMTAGSDQETVGWEEWDHGLKVQEDPALDENLLVDMHYLLPTDDWENPEMWRKANPNLGVSVFEGFLAQQVRRAIERPAVRHEILMLHFNIWPRGEVVPWILPERWKVQDVDMNLAHLRMRPCYVGIMATSGVDIASVVYYFPEFNGQRPAVVMDAFVPADNIRMLEEREKISFRSWIEEGWLRLTPGNIIDERLISASVERRRMEYKFQVQEIVCNPRGGVAVMRQLDEDGFSVKGMLPSYGAMSPAMKEIEKLVAGKALLHGNNKLLNYAMGGFQAKMNAEKDMRPDSEASSGNITPAIAMLMGCSQFLASETDSGEWVAT